MAKSLVTLIGAVFVVIGLLGFFMDPILGIFEVDTLHNIVHLLSGVLAIWMASMGEASAKSYAKIFGVIYAVVAVVGFYQMDTVLGLISVNMADNWLHAALALVFLWLGFTGKKDAMSMPA